MLSQLDRQTEAMNHSLSLALAKVEENQNTHIHYLTADIGRYDNHHCCCFTVMEWSFFLYEEYEQMLAVASILTNRLPSPP